MKNIICTFIVLGLLSSCSIFHRAPKYGCPTSGAAIGAERIISGDPKALKAIKRSKYKGERKIYK